MVFLDQLIAGAGAADVGEPPSAVADDVILGTWFGPGDAIERVEKVETGVVGDRFRLGYRLRVTNADGRFLVEQQAFLDVTAGRITWLRVLCSGFRPA
jgi:hypothetical protein